MAARAASALGWSTSSSTLRSLWTIRAPSATRHPLVGVTGGVAIVPGRPAARVEARLAGRAPAAEAGHGRGRVELGSPAGGGGRGPAQPVGGAPLRVAHRAGPLGAGAAVGLLGQRRLPRLA